MYERVCVTCKETFDPIEGNDTRDFCSWDCEDEYSEAQELNEAVYDIERMQT